MENQVTKNLRRIPIVPIRGSVVFPHTDAFLTFGRKKSVAVINSAFQEDKVVAIFTQKDPRMAEPGQVDLYKVGTIAVITQMMSTEGEIHAVVKGQVRVKLAEIISQEPFLVGMVEEIPEESPLTDEVKALSNNLIELFKKAINLGKQAEIMTVMNLVSGQPEAYQVADQVASLLDIKTSEKQRLLETVPMKKRIDKILEYLAHEVNVLELEKTISTKTQHRFEDQMRKAMLREKKKTKAASMPRDVEEKARKELARLIQMSPHNPEGGYIRNYLDWLCDMPWSKLSPNDVSIKRAAKILEDDHYGLDKAKERILEYSAVMKVKRGSTKKLLKSGDKDESQPTILCFIGPPGVGKTSIGKSIAKALKRKFVRVSLGGIRDEAEIRGHRRTYVGALPGRVI